MREIFVRQNLSIRAILGAIRAIWMVCPPFENFPVRLCIYICINVLLNFTFWHIWQNFLLMNVSECLSNVQMSRNPCHSNERQNKIILCTLIREIKRRANHYFCRTSQMFSEYFIFSFPKL